MPSGIVGEGTGVIRLVPGVVGNTTGMVEVVTGVVGVATGVVGVSAGVVGVVAGVVGVAAAVVGVVGELTGVGVAVGVFVAAEGMTSVFVGVGVGNDSKSQLACEGRFDPTIAKTIRMVATTNSASVVLSRVKRTARRDRQRRWGGGVVIGAIRHYSRRLATASMFRSD
jgi:hypothetical protein